MNVSHDKSDADIVCAYTIGNRKQLSFCKKFNKLLKDQLL